MTRLVEELLPVFDVSDELGVVVAAGRQRTWEALMDVDLIDVGRRRPMVGLLGAVRMLPDIVWQGLHGERPGDAPQSMRLRDLAELPMSGGGWALLGEREGREIDLGLVGKFWRPVIEFADVTPEGFAGFAEPGFAKTIYALGVTPIDDERTLAWGVMRTATTDEHARRWFRRYWTLGVGSGAHVLVNGLLEVVCEQAEAA